MNNHTPRPWEFGDRVPPGKWGFSTYYPISANGLSVAHVNAMPGEVFEPQTEANARLIASAPDLLLNLKVMLRLAANLGPYASEAHREEALALYRGTLKEAEEVIAKAEGREVGR